MWKDVMRAWISLKLIALAKRLAKDIKQGADSYHEIGEAIKAEKQLNKYRIRAEKIKRGWK